MGRGSDRQALSVRYYHPICTKAYAKEQVRLRGALAVLGFEATEAEAFEMIDAEPGKYLGVGPCDNRIDGECQGHDNFSFGAVRPKQQDLFGSG